MRSFHFIEGTLKSWENTIKSLTTNWQPKDWSQANSLSLKKLLIVNKKSECLWTMGEMTWWAAESQVTEWRGFLSLYRNIIHMLKCSFQIIDYNVEICTEQDGLQWNIWTPFIFPGARSTPGHSHPCLPKSSSRHQWLDRHISKGLSCSLPGPQCLVQCEVHRGHSLHSWWMNECWMNSSVS